MEMPPPGFNGIAVELKQTRLERFNDEGDAAVFDITLKMEFSDSRVALLEGKYEYTQVDDLVEEKQLWLPEPVLPGFTPTTIDRKVTIVGTDIEYDMEIRGNMVAKADYGFYPFDEQEADIILSFPPGINWLSPLPTTETSTLLTPGDGWKMIDWNVAVENRDQGGAKSSTLVAEIKVRRDRMYFMVRVFCPSIILVIVSWSGFFIKPQLLMPRFASGFISFLALQTFVATARQDMPAKLVDLCWIDAYTTFIGFLMGFACVENVSAQYIYENFSESITLRLDRASKRAFPSAFILGVGLLMSPLTNNGVVLGLKGVDIAIIICVVVLLGLAVSLSSWTWWQIQDFPRVATKKAIAHYVRFRSMVSPTRRLVPFAFPTNREMNHIFHAIDHDEKEEITIDNWISFIAHCDKDFDHKPHFKQQLRGALMERFGDSLDPNEFPIAFEECVRVIGQLKRTGSVEAGGAGKRLETLKVRMATSSRGRSGDQDGDPEDDEDEGDAPGSPDAGNPNGVFNGGNGAPRQRKKEPANDASPATEGDASVSQEAKRSPLNRGAVRPDIHL